MRSDLPTTKVDWIAVFHLWLLSGLVQTFGTSPRHSELSQEAVLDQTPGSWGPSHREQHVHECPSRAGELLKWHVLAPGVRPSAAGRFTFILKESMITFKQLPALCVILVTHCTVARLPGLRQVVCTRMRGVVPGMAEFEVSQWANRKLRL